MAHDQQMRFFSKVIEIFPKSFRGEVLDIGSYDINGGPHELIQPLEYVGVDLSEGPNVTLVSGGQDLELPSNRFDVAMSSECFEHNPFWIATFQNMIRMTKAGGVVVFSTGSTGRERHGTTDSDGGYAAPAAVATGQEFYRNVSKRMVKRAFEATQFSQTWMGYHPITADLYFVGIKSYRSLQLDKAHPDLRILSSHHTRGVLQTLFSPTGVNILLTRVRLQWLAIALGRLRMTISKGA